MTSRLAIMMGRTRRRGLVFGREKVTSARFDIEQATKLAA